MRVHHINCGTMHPAGGKLFDGQPGIMRRATMVCHCLLLETEAGLVLVETGVGAQATTRPEWLGERFRRYVKPVMAPDETALHHVERLGFAAADVRHILVTHLDLDHAGGLADFPHATVHVAATELDALRSPRDKQERRRYRDVQFAHGPRWAPHDADGEPWFGFTAARQLDGLPPEILMIPLAGHTRGHSGVAVDTGNGWLLNAGDGYFHPGILTSTPHQPAGSALFESIMQAERQARLDNQARLRALVAEHGSEVTIFSAHNAAEFEQLATRAHAT
ncbi:MBL fold metallo-hydrolase [Pseudonocardia sp. TRM90224]|uniref:MBL fold metallo-hydrolase n=1 Tax=Pseudonocardia sp. TRM90224 TaxID=2812678 RepID=UPI001E48EDDD|nr:MBL fold metallo-hydrolase [Pseudonocardia sp. TRM90224]